MEQINQTLAVGETDTPAFWPKVVPHGGPVQPVPTAGRQPRRYGDGILMVTLCVTLVASTTSYTTLTPSYLTLPPSPLPPCLPSLCNDRYVKDATQPRGRTLPLYRYSSSTPPTSRGDKLCTH
ncbi:hypothetical protein RRG08_049435 [Elysia crispata]|uniref:Uncharacterized protein n=1 Tax=Elysia crispata TaxID=231223 RepID=A0AAE0ZS16_9GAST|nr:hypothetical protein RRG08_049435 [Elysia crispata]